MIVSLAAVAVAAFGVPLKAATLAEDAAAFGQRESVDWLSISPSGDKLLYIEPGKPNQNAFVERFNRTFRVEVLDAHLFNRLGDVQRIADEWLTDYNEYRPHESLGNVPPAKFMPRSFKPEVSTFELSA